MQEEEIHSAIHREQVRLAMAQLPTMQMVSFLVAFVLSFVVRDVVPQGKIVAWMTLVLTIVISRAVLYLRFLKTREDLFDGDLWARAHLSLTLLSGVIWGLSAFMIFPAGDPARMYLFVLVIASLSASTTVSHASLKWGPPAWAGPAMLLYAVRCALEGGVYGYSVGALIVMYLFTILSYSFKHHATITTSISLKFENLELVQEVRRTNDILRQDIRKREQVEQDRDKLIGELRKAAAEIKTLQGILPICSSCKKIRDEDGQWKQLESYIREHSQAEFSHGYCPACGKQELQKFKEFRQDSKREKE